MHNSFVAIDDLSIFFEHQGERRYAVKNLDLSLQKGEFHVLLGESGCGKSMTSLALMRLLAPGAIVSEASQVMLSGTDLLDLPEKAMRDFRGKKVAIIFQEPMSALNPVLTVGEQVAEVLRTQQQSSKNTLQQRVAELLGEVGIPEPETQLQAYPHQFSGGMKQRVMIAMALAANAELLIADEPTTALDVTVQAQVLALLKKIQDERGVTVLLITHDLSVAKQVADTISVMYAGHIIESGHAQSLFTNPSHPYTRSLLAAVPSLENRKYKLQSISGQVAAEDVASKACRFVKRCQMAESVCKKSAPGWQEVAEGHWSRCHFSNKIKNLPQQPRDASEHSESEVLAVHNLQVHFPIKKGLLKKTVGQKKVVDGVSFQLFEGETLALVGESGCGKTTLGKAILQLIPSSGGHITLLGQSLTNVSSRQLRKLRQGMQVILQDPASSMNPRMTIGEILAEGLVIQGKKSDHIKQTVYDLLHEIGLDKSAYYRYPHEFSGGQKQRINIARAIALKPKLIVCDEVTSALDVSVQAQILNLLMDLQNTHQLTYLFITHDFSVVAHMADRVAVMQNGKIVEQGETRAVLSAPKHTYTQSLLNSIPGKREEK